MPYSFSLSSFRHQIEFPWPLESGDTIFTLVSAVKERTFIYLFSFLVQGIKPRQMTELKKKKNSQAYNFLMGKPN